jgi:hypothetical protein
MQPSDVQSLIAEEHQNSRSTDGVEGKSGLGSSPSEADRERSQHLTRGIRAAGMRVPFIRTRKVRSVNRISTSGNGASDGSATEGNHALDGQTVDSQVGAELPRRQPGSHGAKIGVVDFEPTDPATLRKVHDGLTGL